MMVRELRHEDAADALESAVRAAVAAGITTPDLGGKAGTREVARWVGEHVMH
jgi:isocitrate/isopropylmalate dehydrogenase